MSEESPSRVFSVRHAFVRPKERIHHFKEKHTGWFWTLCILGVLIFLIITSSAYLLATSPYSRDSIIKSPFTTSYTNGQVTITQNYTPHFYSGWWANLIGYYRQAVGIVWDRIESPQMPGGSEKDIIAQIHALRFDPSKPYVISGDQFDGLYLRNLSIFYGQLLNPHTALSTTDWHNRQRIAVQTLAYGLVALDQLHKPVTTLYPIAPHSVLAANVYGYPSDTMFSLLQAISQLESDPTTRTVTQQLVKKYSGGLEASYRQYLSTVRDTATGMVKPSVHLSSARDAVNRESSFYDNVILWRTEQLAATLGFDSVSSTTLTKLRTTIISTYWDASQGHFIDDLTPGNDHSYSSDWLIALPTGFLNPSQPDDLKKLTQMSGYIDAKQLASPLPIRYTSDPEQENWVVATFMGSYGNEAIWSYWGNLYIQLEIDLYQQTKLPLYSSHVTSGLAAWDNAVVQNRGYPETLNKSGKLLTSFFYESIRRNGWVVGLEADHYLWQQTVDK